MGVVLVLVELRDVEEFADCKKQGNRNDCDEIFDGACVGDHHLACDSQHQHFDDRVDVVAEDHLDELDADDDGHGSGEVGLERFGR